MLYVTDCQKMSKDGAKKQKKHSLKVSTWTFISFIQALWHFVPHNFETRWNGIISKVQDIKYKINHNIKMHDSKVSGMGHWGENINVFWWSCLKTHKIWFGFTLEP